MPFLRMMQHGDGSMALCSGAGETASGAAGERSFLSRITRGVSPLDVAWTQAIRDSEAHEASIPDPTLARRRLLNFQPMRMRGAYLSSLSLGVERVVVNQW